MPTSTRQRTAMKQATKVSMKAETLTANKTATSTSQDVTVRQSQEMVQMLLHCSISSVAYARDLYADACFTERSYDKMASYESYADYVHDNKSADITRSSLHVLTKGGRSEVDRLLTTLENSVFDALEKQCLKALQLNIGPHNEPSHVFESYTFTFSYQIRTGSQKTLGGIELRHSSGATVASGPTFNEIRTTIALFERNLCKFVGSLPALPEQRSLNVVMYYEGAELAYDGFWKTKKDIVFGQDEKWRKDVHNIDAVLDTGHHGVSLKVSHLGYIPSPTSESLSEPGLCIPEDLVFEIKDAGEAELDATIEDRLLHQRSGKPLVTRAVTGVDPPSRCSGIVQDKEVLEPTNSTTQKSQISTQTREDHATRQNLSAMLMASPPAANAGETQLVNSARPRELLNTIPEHERKLKLAANTLGDLELSMWKDTNIVGGKASPPEPSIACQCGSSEEEDDMVECHFCRQWQHLICYGYHGSKDTRLPNIHACYGCLLEEEEAPVLKQLQNLAVQRKGVDAIMKNNCVHPMTLQKQLNCPLQAANQILKHLERQGLLTKEKTAAKRGSQIVVRFAESEEQHQRVEKEYFDPTLHISHHLSVPTISQLPETGLSTQYSLPPQEIPFTLAQCEKPTETEHRNRSGKGKGKTTDGLPGGMDLSPSPRRSSSRLATTTTRTTHVPSKIADKRKRGESEDSAPPETPGKRIQSVFSTFNATRTPMAAQYPDSEL